MAIEGTICHIRCDGKLLLRHKAPGRLGSGKWNGPGGKMRDGESPEQCVGREVEEETDLTLIEPIVCGRVTFFFGRSDEPDWAVHVFSASRFSGEPRPSAEGELRWFAEDQIPYDQMWADDRYWLPPLLSGQVFEGTFWFDERAETVLRREMELR